MVICVQVCGAARKASVISVVAVGLLRAGPDTAHGLIISIVVLWTNVDAG